MSKDRLPLFLILTIVLFNFSAFSQEKDLETEVVDIVKPYSPTIADAFKVNPTPSVLDSAAVKKKEVKYGIFSVPVASTFSPEKGKATNIERAKREKFYDNYATLGFGNYTTILGELFSNFEISRTDDAGFFFRHNSSQGNIKGVELDNHYYETGLDVHYTSRQKGMTYNLEAGAEHQLYNWYGIPDGVFSPQTIDGIDPKQTYFSGYVGGSIAMDNSFFEKTSLQLRYLGDAFSSSEFNVRLLPEFAFPMENLALKVDGDIDYLGGSFERGYVNASGINYSFLNIGLLPSLDYTHEDLSLSIGVAGYFSMDTEHSDTDFSLYPKLNASYRLMDETVIVYGGVEGGLQQNSYYGFKEENPFVSPTLSIAPTKKIYEGFGGIKGNFSNMFGYNLKVAYGKDEHKPFFIANQRKAGISDSKGYEYGNSFNVVYDDLNTLDIFAELQVAISEKLAVGLNVNYYNYNTDLQSEAWNLPNLKASLFSNFNITEQLYGGASIFFVGERKDIEWDASMNTVKTTLDAYVDANLHVGYRFTERLSAFVKGSNLLGDNYEKWNHYPVQGIQALIGATYKFDW